MSKFKNDQKALTDLSIHELRKVDSVPVGASIIGVTKLGEPILAPTSSTPQSPGTVIYQGDWNADTNTPDITNESQTGKLWRVSVAGSTDLGGIVDWKINDLAMKTDTGWLKIINNDDGGGTGGYDEVVDFEQPYNGDYTIPTGKPIGYRLRINLAGNSTFIIKPDPTERFKIFGTGLVYMKKGKGFKCFCKSNAFIEFQKRETDAWKIIGHSGKWVVEDANFWTSFNDLKEVYYGTNDKRIMVEEKILGQHSFSNATLGIRRDSPYDKDVVTDWGGNYSDYSGYFDGLERTELFNAKHVNLFEDLDPSEGAILETYVKKTANDGQYSIIGNFWIDSDNRWTIGLDTQNSVYFDCYVGGVNALTLRAGTVTADGLWHRISVYRVGNRVALYLDGVRIGIGSISHALVGDGNFYMGADGFNNANYRWRGNISDLFIIQSDFYDLDIENINLYLPPWQSNPQWIFV